MIMKCLNDSSTIAILLLLFNIFSPWSCSITENVNKEQFASSRHFCFFDACLPVASQVSPFHHFISQLPQMYTTRAVTP